MTQAAFYRGLEAAQQTLAGLASAASPADRAAAVARQLDVLAAATPDAGRAACRPGCAHCCRHPVGVTLAEALGLRAAIDELPARAAVPLRAAVRRSAAATADRSWAELARESCPLLAQDRCAVYAARPLPCRGWRSADADACAAAAAEVPFDREAFLQALGAAQALGAGDPAPRELRAALAAVLDAADPAAAFARARLAGE
jgi:hypothetical protein